MTMDLFTGACAVIGTLCLVVPFLYRQLQAVEDRFTAKLAQSEDACRSDLDTERKAREDSDKLLRELERDVRQLLVGEVAKNSQALAFVGGKMGELVYSVDELRKDAGLAERRRDPSRETTMMIAALTGAPP